MNVLSSIMLMSFAASGFCLGSEPQLKPEYGREPLPNGVALLGNAFTVHTQVTYRKMSYGFDAEPIPIHESPPVYPCELLNAGRAGTVEIDFVIKDDGTVADVKLIGASDSDFARSSLEAVKRWTYKPAAQLRLRKKVPILAKTVFVFSLSDMCGYQSKSRSQSPVPTPGGAAHR